MFAVLVVVSCKKEVRELSSEAPKPNLSYNIVELDSAVLSSGSLQRLSLNSQFILPRPVDVWLPSDYSESKSYAVLYMHDGQMLFDSTSTWNQQEWKVDEWASQLMKTKKTKDFIVVGIHNISEIRWLDLFPQKAWNYMPSEVRDSLLNASQLKNEPIELNGDNYLKFLVKELKPIIDNKYAVKKDKAHTFVAGSSMGGLMSMYAISEYPEVFQGAACLSTHWVGAAPSEDNPYPQAIFKYMENNFPEAGTHLVYFDYGDQTLDQFYPQYAPKVDSILSDKGYSETNSRNLFFKGTNHSENAWNKRLNYPFEFLLGNK
jgi:predicted alpha/beta superfamily hydrolase